MDFFMGPFFAFGKVGTADKKRRQAIEYRLLVPPRRTGLSG
jgi:hypothetical protein